MWFIEVYPLAETLAAAWVSLEKSKTRGIELPPFVVVEAWSGKISKSSADLSAQQASELEDFIHSRETWACSPFETLFLLRCPEGFSPMPMAAGVWGQAGSSAAYTPQSHTIGEARKIIDYWLLETQEAEQERSAVSAPDDTDWPTITKVAKGLGINKGCVSPLVDSGRLRDNGKTGTPRRINPASVLEYCEKEGIAYNDA